MAEVIEYTASPTGSKLHASDKFVRAILGPIGSGKSVTCCVEIIRRCCQQQAHKGIRKSRWVIIRNTYRELIDTTLNTWNDWVPSQLGELMKQDMKFDLKFRLPDRTRVEASVLFRALDRPGDVKKLLSLELTGGFINEAKEIPKAIFDMLQGRVGRYPSKREGGPSWWGVVLDSNPPDADHWIYRTFEEDLPENFQIWHQPSGISEEAENTENLPQGYYQNMMYGKDQEWINVFVHGQYGFVSDGKPIYNRYKDDIHYVQDPIILPKNAKIIVGIDFGLTPAAAICFLSKQGQFQVVDELCTFDMGAVNFAKLLHQKLRTDHLYREIDLDSIEFYGDPAGEARAQTDEVTPFQILSKEGINAIPAHTNDFTIRVEVVSSLMSSLDMSGKPSFAIGPRAKMARKACAGGYKYKRMQVTGDDKYFDKPDKNKYSHIAEAIQYAALGAVGDDMVIGGFRNMNIDYSHLNRMIV